MKGLMEFYKTVMEAKKRSVKKRNTRQHDTY